MSRGSIRSFVDATLRHEIDDPEQLEALLDQGVVLQAPADTSADYFVLEVADEHGAIVVSNDQFDEFRAEYPWIEERRVPYMVVKGEVHLYRPGESWRFLDGPRPHPPPLM